MVLGVLQSRKWLGQSKIEHLSTERKFGLSELTVVAEQLVIDSRDVAEMVGRPHNDVLKDIRRVIEHLGDGGKTSLISNYFIEATYTDSMNRQKVCYHLTKKGCELFATRMTITTTKSSCK